MQEILHFAMTSSPYCDLSKRERQIMEVVHRLGRAGVSEVFERLPDAPSYNAVRVTMAGLETKGRLRHVRDGRRFIYRPVQERTRSRRRAAKHVLATFFGDSVPEAVSALLDARSRDLTEDELGRLEDLVAEARRARGEAR